MRIEKSEKKVFITSETDVQKEEVQLIVTGWKIVLNGTFNVEELLEWLEELWYKRKVWSSFTDKNIYINDCISKPLTKTFTHSQTANVPYISDTNLTGNTTIWTTN